MKKILCFLLVIVLAVSAVGCSFVSLNEKENETVLSNDDTDDINAETNCETSEQNVKFSPDGNSEQFYKDFDMWISRLATEHDRGLPLSREDALEILKEQLIIAYENTYGEYVPKYEDPGSMSGDKERLPYIIENLEITESDGAYYTVPVIWNFLIEIESGKIYKYYDGLDKMLIPFEPLDKNALSFAG